jgi:hypothetical protein
VLLYFETLYTILYVVRVLDGNRPISRPLRTQYNTINNAKVHLFPEWDLFSAIPSIREVRDSTGGLFTKYSKLSVITFVRTLRSLHWQCVGTRRQYILSMTYRATLLNDIYLCALKAEEGREVSTASSAYALLRTAIKIIFPRCTHSTSNVH